MAGCKAKASHLLQHYQLTEEVCRVGVSDKHIGEISCEDWRKLPPCFELETVVVSDLERDFKTEEDRRIGFFRKWKARKGFDATYIVLITALLEINCRKDAEGVCKLLQNVPGVPSTAQVSCLSMLSSSTHLPEIMIPTSETPHLPNISPSPTVSALPKSNKSSSKGKNI